MRERFRALEAAFLTHRPCKDDFVVELRPFDRLEREEHRRVASAIVDRARGEFRSREARRALVARERVTDLHAGFHQSRRVQTEPRRELCRLLARDAVARHEHATERSFARGTTRPCVSRWNLVVVAVQKGGLPLPERRKESTTRAQGERAVVGDACDVKPDFVHVGNENDCVAVRSHREDQVARAVGGDGFTRPRR